MSLSFNGTEPQSITWNGADVQSVTMDGVEVWSAHPPFLVRMRYDANEATHVKDLVGGYTITTNTGGAVPAAADPFGGNNALNLSDLWVKYGGPKAIKQPKMTVACWIKLTDMNKSDNTLVCSEDAYYHAITIQEQGKKIVTQTDGNMGSDTVVGTTVLENNKWYFIEVSYDNGIVRIFIDGRLETTANKSTFITYDILKNANQNMWIGQWPYGGGYASNKFKGHIYDFCILNGVWHTEDYNVPTAYI